MEHHELPVYRVRKALAPPGLDGDWEGPAWKQADTLTVAHFLAAGSPHRPVVQARVVYDAAGVYGIFRVEDRYVLCTRQGLHSKVHKDSCVEFFVRPKADKGYFNFEMNCGGSMLVLYVEDPTRLNDPARPDVTFARYTPLPEAVASQVRIRSSLPPLVTPEIDEPVTWTLEFHVPFTVFEAFAGPLGAVPGQAWRANFNKCADDCSHPHWATWASVGEKLDFHQPDRFGRLLFCP